MAFLDEPLDTPMGDRYYNYYESYAYEADINPQTGEKMNPIAERIRTIITAVTNFFTKSIPKFFRDLFSKSPEARNDPSTQVLVKAIQEKTNEGKEKTNVISKGLDWFISRNKRLEAQAKAKTTIYQHKREKLAAKKGWSITGDNDDDDDDYKQSPSVQNDNNQYIVDDNSFTAKMSRDVADLKKVVGGIVDIGGVIYTKWKNSRLESPYV